MDLIVKEHLLIFSQKQLINEIRQQPSLALQNHSLQQILQAITVLVRIQAL